MARLITVALRLLIWCLLSGDLGTTNVAIGLAVALALPMGRHVSPEVASRVAAMIAEAAR